MAFNHDKNNLKNISQSDEFGFIILKRIYYVKLDDILRGVRYGHQMLSDNPGLFNVF